MTLTAFAASIGEKVTTVHGWMSGRRNPGLNSLVAIERATKGAVRATDFLSVTPLAKASNPAPKPKPKRSAATPAKPANPPKREPKQSADPQPEATELVEAADLVEAA